jgi:hypothetical protein
MHVASDLEIAPLRKKAMRLQSLTPPLLCSLALSLWSSSARAEHSRDNFPIAREDASGAHQRSVRSSGAKIVAAKTATLPAETAAPMSPASPRSTPPLRRDGAPARDQHEQRERDQDETKAARIRRDWILALEGVTHAPIDMGVQVGLETPQRVRLSGGLGWVPGSYMDLLTGIAANASGNAYGKALLKQASYDGRTWRIQAGFRPFRKLGLYADVGYSRLTAKGSLDLTSSGVPALEALGGGYEATTRLDLWLVELGYQAQIADRFVLGLALGCMGTFDATTRIVSVNGAPSSPLLGTVSTQADTALEKYGFMPTLTLRLGFDMI